LPVDGPGLHDPAALARLLDRAGARVDADGRPLLPTVAALPYLRACAPGAPGTQWLPAVEYASTRRDVHQVLLELGPDPDAAPDTLLVVTTVRPVQAMAWFRPDEVRRLDERAEHHRRLRYRSELPLGFSVLRCHWR